MAKENYTWIKTEFQNTIKVSTYLIALVVSDFECVKSHAHLPLSKYVNIDMCVRKEAARHARRLIVVLQTECVCACMSGNSR